jgi:hypothetical protein
MVKTVQTYIKILLVEIKVFHNYSSAGGGVHHFAAGGGYPVSGE